MAWTGAGPFEISVHAMSWLWFTIFLLLKVEGVWNITYHHVFIPHICSNWGTFLLFSYPHNQVHTPRSQEVRHLHHSAVTNTTSVIDGTVC